MRSCREAQRRRSPRGRSAACGRVDPSSAGRGRARARQPPRAGPVWVTDVWTTTLGLTQASRARRAAPLPSQRIRNFCRVWSRVHVLGDQCRQKAVQRRGPASRASASRRLAGDAGVCTTTSAGCPGAPRGCWLAFGKQTEPSAVREMPAKPLTDAAPSPPGPRGDSGGVAVTRSRGLRPEGRGRRPGCQLREGAGPPSQHAGPAPGALNLLHPTRLPTSGQASPNTLAFWVTSV